MRNGSRIRGADPNQEMTGKMTAVLVLYDTASLLEFYIDGCANQSAGLTAGTERRAD